METLLLDMSEPNDAAGFNQRGMARFAQGDWQGAFGDFESATRHGSVHAESWNNLGILRQRTDGPARALVDFNRALTLKPNYAEALNNRARARQALGDAEGALADFERALSCAAGSFAASVHHNRGSMHLEQGNLPAALADFDCALELDPQHVATYVNRGNARRRAGDLAGARADFDHALEMAPPELAAHIYHDRGGVRVLQNDFTGAIADYDQALALEPAFFLAYLSRGHARYHLRDRRALVDYRLAYSLNPEGAVREMVRTILDDLQQRPEAALENCVKHLRINSTVALAHARRGVLLLLLGRDAEAQPHLDRFLKLAPTLERGFHSVLTSLRDLRFGNMASARSRVET
jgi:tetratricopeptide (TPR) repeat protein